MINIQNLNFTYGKSKIHAVKDISYRIAPGEIFGFLGPNGAGKTTTQRLIIGLLKNYDGTIEVFGRERREYGNDFFEEIGVAFDFPNLYLKLSGLDNLKLIGSYYKNHSRSPEELLDSVGLLKDRDIKTENYSKGMKMRLNFVRSLMHDPKLLFLDEPTSGLDPVNAKIIKNTILDLKAQGKTVFLTTHNMTVAEQLCDRVAFIVEGSIPIIGSPKELMSDFGENKVIAEYEQDGKLQSSEFALDTLDGNKDFIDIIRTKNIKTLHTKEATLEDIFIKLTGKSL
jgi:fluoroquinolone transport system ATP-binding protein